MRLVRWAALASGAAALIAARRALRVRGEPAPGSSDTPEPAGIAATPSLEAPGELVLPATGAEGAVHLMMEDGSVVDASEATDPDGRLRYLADNLLGPGAREA
jgi:hypothetical protein